YSPGLGHTVYRRRKPVANMIPSKSDFDFSPIIGLFPRHIARPLSQIPQRVASELLEIRIGLNRPVMLCSRTGEYYVSATGCTREIDEALHVDAKDLAAVLDQATSSSVYALSDAM